MINLYISSGGLGRVEITRYRYTYTYIYVIDDVTSYRCTIRLLYYFQKKKTNTTKSIQTHKKKNTDTILLSSIYHQSLYIHTTP